MGVGDVAIGRGVVAVVEFEVVFFVWGEICFNYRAVADKIGAVYGVTDAAIPMGEGKAGRSARCV